MKEKRQEFDLSERTLKFAKDVRNLVQDLPDNVVNREDGRQLIRSSGSVGANYVEANEAFSRRDFLLRIKICKKEASESLYWLKLLLENNCGREPELKVLLNESEELSKIFASILINSGCKDWRSSN